ncbi:MAG: hypothetical protein QMC36_02900 [Patescibacteria group bacterium]
MLADETGVFVPEVFSMDDLKNAVAEMTPKRALSMRSACLKRAAEFGRERFEREVRSSFSK